MRPFTALKDPQPMSEWSFVYVTDIQPGSPKSFRFDPRHRENWQTARRQIVELRPEFLLDLAPGVAMPQFGDKWPDGDASLGFLKYDVRGDCLAKTFIPLDTVSTTPGAYGPGGLRARISRHLSKEKPIHWHVDQLTSQAETRAIALPGANECDLVSALLETGKFTTPLRGFGSTDCRNCESHLLVITQTI